MINPAKYLGWKYVKPALLGLWLQLPGLAAPFVVPLALRGAVWDAAPTPDSMGTTPIVRGDLPGWASGFATPNERLPGGTYEAAVASVLQRWGRWICSWYWLGLRNRGLGFDRRYARPVAFALWTPDTGLQEADGLWFLRKNVGLGLQLKVGWRTYADGHDWVAVPCFTITR